MTLNLEWPWILVLLPLPLLVYWLIPAVKTQTTALRIPNYARLKPSKAVTQSLSSHPLKISISAIVWLLLLLAAARPISTGTPVQLPGNARDLMLAVDLSGSMETQDMVIQQQRTNRLIAIKAVLNPFIDRRKGDRIGLILFGSQAYLQSPLSFDRTTIATLLNEAQIAMAGRETSIGDAIGLAVKRLRSRPAESRVLILVTDGANTAGVIPPLKAAQLAAEEHITIYTIGVGAEEMIQPGLFGSSFGERRVNPSADLDEKTLTEISNLTGGRYFRARNTEELEGIYHLLDQLEPVLQEAETVRPKKSLYYLPLMAAIFIAFFTSLFSTLIRKLIVRTGAAKTVEGL